MQPPANTLVIDVETQKSFQEVGGQRFPEKLMISVAGVYSYSRDEYRVFEESEMPLLEKWIKEADLIVGFNIIHFDLPVMAPYFEIDTTKLPTLDIMAEIVDKLGHRVTLASVAQATLHEGKTGDGLEAIKQFKEGRIDELKKYCENDVRITKGLFDYGLKEKHLKITNLSKATDDIVEFNWLQEEEKDQTEQISLL
ncbi:ribonuclease H-like domain-containing protein [Patescibacteria group bacterium]